MLEIDGNAIARHGLHLSDTPIGPRRKAHAHAWFDDGVSRDDGCRSTGAKMA